MPAALGWRLVAKIRRALSVTHIERGEAGLRIADHKTVRGGIEWDFDQDGHAPLLVIDGQEITWEELGRMMMSFEGWQFKLEIHDKSGKRRIFNFLESAPIKAFASL